MGKSVIDAMQDGQWNFEPGHQGSGYQDPGEFRATDAEPGSQEKLAILALRIQRGLPLWHPDDRHAEDGPVRPDA